MKHFKKIMVLFLAMAMLCSVAVFAESDPRDEEYPGWPGYYGNPTDGCYGMEGLRTTYPMLAKFMRIITPAGFGSWYKYDLMPNQLVQMSSIWAALYYINDPDITEKWPQVYLDRFDTVLANAQTDYPVDGAYPHAYDYRVDSYSFNGNRLNMQCSAYFKLTYFCEYDAQDGVYIVRRYGGDSANVFLAFRDKDSGKLVYMGRVEDFTLNPKYKYSSWYDNLPDELKEIEGTFGCIKDECTVTKSVEVEMPTIFDPEKHDVTVYFQTNYDDYSDIYGIYYYLDEYCFHDPHVILTGEYVAPETTTTEPEVTTTEPEVTTTEPEVTTPEPEVTTTAVVPPEPDFVRGDANGDGKVNLRDASQMLKYLAAWQGIKVQVESCDLNGNGRVDLADVSTTLKIIAGWDV